MNLSEAIPLVAKGIQSLLEINMIQEESTENFEKMTVTLDFQERSRQEILKDLPITEELEKPNDKCPICWDCPKGYMQRGRRCQHYFHKECLQEWLQDESRQMICPLCQQKV